MSADELKSLRADLTDRLKVASSSDEAAFRHALPGTAEELFLFLEKEGDDNGYVRARQRLAALTA